MQRPNYSSTFGSQRATEAKVFGTIANLSPTLPHQSTGNQQPMRQRLPCRQQQTLAFGDFFVEDVCLVQSSLEYAYGTSTTRADAAE